MESMGHTDHQTTLQIYSHATEHMDKDMMRKMEDLITLVNELNE